MLSSACLVPAGNFLLTNDGRLCILDFGLMTTLEVRQWWSQSQTEPDSFCSLSGSRQDSSPDLVACHVALYRRTSASPWLSTWHT